MNTIRPQQNGEPASQWRSSDALAQQTAKGDTEPVVENVGVVGGRMSGKDGVVNTGDLFAQERRETADRSQSHHSSVEVGNDHGAKDDRKEDHQSEGQGETSSSAVPATGKQDEEALWQRHKAQRGVWSEKMLMALEGGIKGGVWFSLIDKVCAEPTLQLAWERVQHNAGACGVDCMTVGHFAKDSQSRLLAVKEHLKSGTYQPKPVKRVYIPKPGSSESRSAAETASLTFSKQSWQQTVRYTDGHRSCRASRREDGY